MTPARLAARAIGTAAIVWAMVAAVQAMQPGPLVTIWACSACALMGARAVEGSRPRT